MKKHSILLVLFFVLFACNNSQQTSREHSPSKDSLATLATSDSDSQYELCTYRVAKKRKGHGKRSFAAGFKNQFWDYEDLTLTVAFQAGGDERVKEKIRNTAKKWENYCGIRFQFVTGALPDTDIVISLNDSLGTWSYIGMESQKHKPSMNYSDLRWRSRQSKYDYYVLHEFGHALGLMHEHQNPDVVIPWDSAKVYAHFAMQNPPWSSEMVNENIFLRYSDEYVEHTRHDKKSIMIYAISKDWTKGGVYSAEATTEISDSDQVFINSKYPKR